MSLKIYKWSKAQPSCFWREILSCSSVINVLAKKCTWTGRANRPIGNFLPCVRDVSYQFLPAPPFWRSEEMGDVWNQSSWYTTQQNIGRYVNPIRHLISGLFERVSYIITNTDSREFFHVKFWSRCWRPWDLPLAVKRVDQLGCSCSVWRKQELFVRKTVLHGNSVHESFASNYAS